MLGLQMLTNPVVMRFSGLQIFALVARFCRNFVGKIRLSLRLLLYQLSYWCSYSFVIAEGIFRLNTFQSAIFEKLNFWLRTAVFREVLVCYSSSTN